MVIVFGLGAYWHCKVVATTLITIHRTMCLKMGAGYRENFCGLVIYLIWKQYEDDISYTHVNKLI